MLPWVLRLRQHAEASAQPAAAACTLHPFVHAVIDVQRLHHCRLHHCWLQYLEGGAPWTPRPKHLPSAGQQMQYPP